MYKIFIAFLAGAALGILFAPNRGAETRKKLHDSLDELKISLQDKYDDLTTDREAWKNEVIN